ncbi:MAG: cupin domain-containing protein [Gaiellaceae bacterium]
MELDVHSPSFLRPGEGETVTDRAERTLRILVELDQLIVTWFRYEPGEEGPKPHVHRRHADAFYVLEGELEFGLGPEVEKVRGPAGTFAAAPPNVVHTFRNTSDSTAIFLNVHAPSMGFGDFLRGGSDEHFDQFDPPADGGRPFADAIVCGPGEGERFERENRVLVIKSDMPELSVFDLTFHPGWKGVDPHHHDDHVDSFFVLEGEVDFIVGDEQRRAGPGTFVSDPPGARHGFRNPGPAPIRVLNLHTPDAGFADGVRRG